jgi:hypothetical protein
MTDSLYKDQDAINAALNQNWEEAIKINTTLLKKDKENINILNRLGFAYVQTGDVANAKKMFNKVTKLDTYNQIAIKNLKKLSLVNEKDLVKQNAQVLSPLSFLEEPGKTKIIECINAAPIAVLSSISPGEEVVLKARNHTVEVRSSNNTYLAALPDDLSFRIIKFLDGGNTYQTLVQSIGKNVLMVFIRELTRGKRFVNQPSFASTGIYMPTGRAERTDEALEMTDDAEPADDKEE